MRGAVNSDPDHSEHPLPAAPSESLLRSQSTDQNYITARTSPTRSGSGDEQFVSGSDNARSPVSLNVEATSLRTVTRTAETVFKFPVGVQQHTVVEMDHRSEGPSHQFSGFQVRD